ncbi:MAG: hypothetical protein IPF98_14870 [Gemmatimonadetes bacterium]|nr:hypothetical protein [Gemmatimonadota bacterium]
MLPYQVAESTVMLIRALLAQDEVPAARLRADHLRRTQQTQQGDLRRHTIADTLVAWHSQDECLMRRGRDDLLAIKRPPIPRAEQTYLAVRQAGSLICGDSVSYDEDLVRLGELHRSGSRFGGQDFPSSVLFSSLRRLGFDRDARRLRTRYLNRTRCEPYEVPATLLSLAKQPK